jgi:hypothetical protein
MKRTLEQRSPVHFRNERFLADLGKLRCLYLLRDIDCGCDRADSNFDDIVKSSQQAAERDNAWLSLCEAIMVKRYATMCNCAGDKHYFAVNKASLYACARIGLTDCLLAMTVAWPNLAIKHGQESMLAGFLFGHLEFMFDQPSSECTDELVCSSLQTIVSSYIRFLLTRDGRSDRRKALAPANSTNIAAVARHQCHRLLNEKSIPLVVIGCMIGFCTFL